MGFPSFTRKLKALATPKTMILVALGLAIALVVLQIIENRRRRRRGEPFLPLLFGAATLGLGVGKFLGADKKVQEKVGLAPPARKGTNPIPNPNCKYSGREWRGDKNAWLCPAGTKDTGAMWDKGDDGDKQCEQCPGVVYTAPRVGTNPVPNPSCQYRGREWRGDKNAWECPAGSRDTGANWDKGDDGDKQCETCPGISYAPPAPPSRKGTNPIPNPVCKYSGRQWRGDKNAWLCPTGTRDTGANWDRGDDGDKQCEQCPGVVYTAAPRVGTNPVPKAECTYRARELRGGSWLCPAGSRDTGANWDKGDDGDKQCETCPGVVYPPPKVNPAPKAGCTYRTRELKGNAWVCPVGTRDTGANWDGGVHGDKQCEQCGPAVVAPAPTVKVTGAPIIARAAKK